MDQSGRLSRLELREVIRRRIDTIRAQVDIITGNEGAIQQLDPLVTNQDINALINSAIIKRSVDVNVADNTIMADQVVVDVVTGVVEYPLPADVMFLRAVYWKPVFLTPASVPVPPAQRIFMYEDDQDSDIQQPLIQGSGYPSYRRRLNNIVLNQVPQEDNPQGLLFDYTKNFLVLQTDDQMIETPLAQVIQEVVIMDVVIEIITERMKIDATEQRQTLANFEERLTLAVTNYHAPKTIRMTTGTVMARPPWGRRSFGWSRRTWWRGSGTWG